MLNLSQIAEVLHCPLRANRLASAATQPHVSLLLTDSRSLSFADQTLFFALVTAKGDGHHYISELYQKGVRAFVISRPIDDFRNTCPEAWFFEVPDTLDALQRLAAWHRSRFSYPVVGITGSNGKTIVKEWLYQMLHDVRHIVRSPRSFNSQVGVPLSVWQMNDTHSMALIEAGISEKHEMDRLERIIRPTIGLLTNIGTAHATGFDNQQQKLVEKLQLFRDSEVIIYNADIPGINDALEIAGVGARSMSWTRHHKDAQVEVFNVTRSADSTTVQYGFMGLDGRFSIPMTDEASFENAMNCLMLMLYLGLMPDDIAQRMQRLTPLAMRLEVVEGKRGCMLINDAYSCDMTSLEIALEFQKRRASSSLSNTLVLSDILQLDCHNRTCCRQLAKLCSIHDIRKLICIGPFWTREARTLIEELNDIGLHIITDFFPSTDEFLTSDEIDRMRQELVLLKGARSFQFERISEVLQLRRHETILEVDLDAIVHNLNRYRSHLNASTRLTCMVKAFGYGTGSYELAKTLQDQNVDYLAVAVADEGADLRRQGIRVPIIVMNPEMSAFRTIIENQLEPEIYSFRLLDAFMAETRAMGVTHYPVHVKIDSGMHRLGFQPQEIDRLIATMKQQDSLTIRSVFSHFATADDPQQESFVHEQKRRFDLCADAIRKAFPYTILRHICNSAGIEKYSQYQMEMCRLGIGLYGFEASEIKMDLEPVASLKSTILQIKDIPETETVGYMRNGKIHRPSRIAMVPIGYADGYDRRLGNGGADMIVKGRRCPTLGNVCMDVTFLDVTDCPEAQEGCEVEIFGRNLPLNELSDKLGTITYEVLSTISTRVKRVYFKG
ncbi:MAG: bifunctional UDP-N-acetylmuramoyl-tripeptide:D-alanyl-D-alanine ligase/alanine racemase [Bacteroidales bacterium]|nr:bifunctional UDP-N-acetylmuramoyl-tripeptide:D-alanyl-D-alanine ligase/alanine racemase [Candidatus Liminaster caballi]